MKPAPVITTSEALNKLNDMATGFLISQTFFTACNLGVFEELSGGPMTAEDMVPRLNIHPNGCQRLLIALKELGLIERENNQYKNSELAEFLTSKSQLPLGALSAWGVLYRMWEFLPDALREYSPRWQQALGTSSNEVFDALYEDPIRLRQFTQHMTAYGILQGQLIAQHFDFAPYRCVMDIAGGAGSISIQIGLRYPHLQGIITDVPAVCKITEEHIQANGLTDRFSAQAADLFEGPYPLGADVVILGWVLHDWSDESCSNILRNCFNALSPRGALLIIEGVLNDDFSGALFKALLSLHMLVACEPGARERNEEEYRTLLEEAGFNEVVVIRLKALRDLVVARKP
jgi:O-methyltransferase domain/Dimerisation domain